LSIYTHTQNIMSSEIIAKEDLNSLHIVGGHGTKLNVGNHKLNQLSYYFEVSSSFVISFP